VPGVVGHKSVEWLGERNVAALWISEQEIRHRVSRKRSAERVGASRRAVIEALHANLPVVAASFEAVRPGKLTERAVHALLVEAVRLARVPTSSPVSRDRQ